MDENQKILEVKDLVIQYHTDESGICRAVNGVTFDLKRGETLGLVGETGAGKTTIALGILRLLAEPAGKVLSGEIRFKNENLLTVTPHQMRKVRGKQISMIFQDPMTALNPIDPIGRQIAEVIALHSKVSKAEAAVRAAKVLEMVGIPAERSSDYPHQFSGGMKQRIIIAIALACSPELLIADEPTTALDVTIQAQVLDMINDLKRELHTSMLLITHDLGVVAEMCDRVAIVYAGEIVEIGDVAHIFNQTAHPYTKGLFGSLPSVAGRAKRLTPIMGLMPDPTNLPEGCNFAPRCSRCEQRCRKEEPQLKEISPGHQVRCFAVD